MTPDPTAGAPEAAGIEISLYNTARRSREVLQPVKPGQVSLYVCGPTVYDRAHIGNARPAIVFDVLFRFLRKVYGADAVTYVRNITDIDDKINARAVQTGRSIRDITEETVAWHHEDLAALGVLAPTYEPRATDYVAEMITMISELIEAGAAYAADGHVLFSVKDFGSYGALARRSLDDMIAGARVEVAPYKRDPMDFVLWKPSTDSDPGWESPFGYGRPGWHIECSAMSRTHLGDTFDIHGGGIDLAFPHHENERAQSLAAAPESEFARIWMHNGFVQVEGEKMSKSLGNFITVHDLSGSVPGEVIRMAMLTTQYRQPFDWTAALAAEARTVLTRWRRIAADGDAASAVPAGVLAALADDLNTPKAIAELHRLANAGDADGLASGAALLGLLTPELGAWAAERTMTAAVSEMVAAILAARQAARARKDFAAADRLRDGLAAAGVLVRDGAAGAEPELTDAFDEAALSALAATARGENSGDRS